MEKKYEFTGETMGAASGVTLHRIRAIRDFGGVMAREVGGWIETEDNLSHDGNAWVGGYAEVSGSAWVGGDAEVSGSAVVCDSASVSGDAEVGGHAVVGGSAEVGGSAWVYGDAVVDGSTRVGGSAEVGGSALVGGSSRVGGRAVVSGSARVSGGARISDGAWIEKTSDHFVDGPAGSRDAFVTFYRTLKGISVVCGCFEGSIDEFLAKVQKTHGDNAHGQAYRLLADVAKIRILGGNGK